MITQLHALKCISGYKLHKSQEKINHLIYMDDIKLFSKSEKELETLIQAVKIYSQDIGMEFDMRYIHNEKQKTTHDGRNRNTKPREN